MHFLLRYEPAFVYGLASILMAAAVIRSRPPPGFTADLARAGLDRPDSLQARERPLAWRLGLAALLLALGQFALDQFR